MTHKYKETYEYTHKGISIFVRIDYINNKIDLVEPQGEGNFRLKKWNFGGRGVEFMNGWLNILEAMQEAIKDAKQKYEHNLAEETKFRVDKIADTMIAVQELEDKE